MENIEINSQLKEILLDYKKDKDLYAYLSRIKALFDHDDMAIIGISCELPNAEDHVQFWSNLIKEKESISNFSKKRTEDFKGLIIEEKEKGGFLNNVDHFDADYFKIPPKMAEQMDPYHRKTLEAITNCIEDAGYYKEQLFNTKTGVFIGHDSTHRLVSNYFDFLNNYEFASVLGAWTGMLASRVSHLFNLKGPAMVLDSGCSSAMIAIDTAIKSIKNGDCETAFVGGINLFFSPHSLDSSLQSADYCFRNFDHHANGTIWSEGIACVYIKPLSKAITDKDHIYGVIKGVALNNDGKTGSLLALNKDAQKEVILQAWERAGISAEDISYIESHGTGMILGDLLEVEALTEAFRIHTNKKQFCGIGSVKSNIGHTVGSSGVVALIKVLMSLKHGVIPSTINFQEPNQLIDFMNSPLYVQNGKLKWTDFTKETIMGISSFSFTGTNAHLVLESYSLERVTNDFQELIFPISAKNNELMIKTVERLQNFLKEGEYRIEDISYTMSCCRNHQDFRAVIITDSVKNLTTALDDLKIMLYQEKSNVLVSSESTDRIYCDYNLDDAIGHKTLDFLALKYMNKNNVNFHPLFDGMDVFKCSLPPTEFDRKRFWATIAKKKDDFTKPNESNEKEIKHSNNVEELLQEAWSETLGYDQINRNDNFLELGGDSIIGFKIIGHLSAVLQLDIPIMSIFDYPVFSDYVDYIHNLQQADDGLDLNEKSEIIDEEKNLDEELTFPLISAQRGSYWISQMMNGDIDDHIIGIMPNDKRYSFEHIVGAVHQLTERHDALRARFFFLDDVLVQAINREVKVDVEIFYVNSEEALIERTLKSKIKEISRPFNLDHPPLLRVYNIIMNSIHDFVVFDIHHIIADGVSMNILVREFWMLMEGRVLPEKSYHYPQIMRKMYQREADALNVHLDWWLGQFKDGAPVLNIATDRPRPPVQSYKGFRVKTKMNQALLSCVKAFALKTECTLYMVLLGGLYQLICKLTNETDHVIGTLSANRNSPEEWNIVGMLVNTLPLRINLDQNMTVSNYFYQLKQLIVDYFSHQGVSYEMLLDQMGTQRSASRNPLFDVYFSLQNVELGLDPGEELIEPDVVSTKYDIMITAQELGDELIIDWDCRSDLFNIERIERMATRYIVFLERMIQDVNNTIKELDCLLEEERSLVLKQFKK